MAQYKTLRCVVNCVADSFVADLSRQFDVYVMRQLMEICARERQREIRIDLMAATTDPVATDGDDVPRSVTATIWGWAQGNVIARREQIDRRSESAAFVRNVDSEITLWRIAASRLRSFTDREYARLQTFPDTWVFHGSNKRHIHQQVGNAVPVQFAYRVAAFVADLHAAQSTGVPMRHHVRVQDSQMEFNL